MVINTTHINKNNQPPLILTELTERKKTVTYDFRNPAPGLGQLQYVVGLNRSMGSQPFPLEDLSKV
jgi:hypothetical protein